MRNICRMLNVPPVKSSSTFPMLQPTVLRRLQLNQACMCRILTYIDVYMYRTHCLSMHMYHVRRHKYTHYYLNHTCTTNSQFAMHYLWYVFQKSDRQLDIRDHIEKVKPVQLTPNWDKQRNEYCQPEDSQNHHRSVGNPLTLPLWMYVHVWAWVCW